MTRRCLPHPQLWSDPPVQATLALLPASDPHFPITRLRNCSIARPHKPLRSRGREVELVRSVIRGGGGGGGREEGGGGGRVDAVV